MRVFAQVGKFIKKKTENLLCALHSFDIDDALTVMTYIMMVVIVIGLFGVLIDIIN